MKIAIRAFVLAMLVTGFAADHMLATNAAPTTATTTMTASASALPMPSCNPGTTCGLREMPMPSCNPGSSCGLR